MSSVFAVADSFGYLPDGTYDPSTDVGLLGEMWASLDQPITVTDLGGGRKTISYPGSGYEHLGLKSVALGDVTEVTLCFRLYRYNTDKTVIAYVGNSSGKCGWIFMDASGYLCYGPGNTPTSGSVYTSDDTVGVGQTLFCEVHLVLDNSAGSVAFYINNVASGSDTGIDTCYNGSTCDFITMGSVLPLNSDGYSGFSAGWKFTDVIIHFDTSPIGNAQAPYFPASADGSDTDFTPSSGSDHYAMIDEIPTDEDTTTNDSSGTSGDRDSYLGASGLSGYTVLSVGAHVRARKTSAGSASVKLGVAHSGGAEDQSGAKTLGDSYANYVHFADVDPSTSATWTLSNADAAPVSLEVA